MSRTSLDLALTRVMAWAKVTKQLATEQVALAELDDSFGALRLLQPSALQSMRESLERTGQLQPVVAFRRDGQLQVLDGLKRLHAARALRWTQLWTRVVRVDAARAKLQLFELHGGQGLSELEEAWLIRALHRDDRMSQGAIAHHLGRHKSWVCRRLLLAEGLEETVQVDVRLGLLAPRAAVALAALPRGNGQQAEAARIVVDRGMTVRQTERMVADLSQAGSADDFRVRLTRWTAPRTKLADTARPAAVAVSSQAETICADVAALQRIAVRLHARLLQRQLPAADVGPTTVLRLALKGLPPVLDALSRSVAALLQGDPLAAAPEEAS